MSFKRSRTAHLTTITPRQWSTRLSLIFLMIASLALIVMSKTNNPAVSRVRMAMVDVITPVIYVASKPFEVIASFTGWIEEMARLRADNIALKNANLQLLQWQSTAKNMQAENNSLRALMNVIPVPKNSYITTRIVTDTTGPYVRSALISGGIEQNIKKNQAVINEYGLVGRVIEAGTTNSRVLLISDINSRIPVMGELSREKTIMVGNNSSLPSLSYLSSESKIKVGERIVTSGDGGIFPQGIAVGVVTKIQGDTISVQPFTNGRNLEYVSVVEHSL